MGIDVNCKQCHKWLGKQCFCYRAELLDALRAYLKNNKEKHELELKYINWFYREEYDDEERVTTITEEEKTRAKQELRQNKLDGLFCWIFLEEEDFISHQTAARFLDSYDIIKEFMKDGFLDLGILTHAAHYKHNLECW